MDTLDSIERVFRTLDQELWVLTSAAGGARGGLTATSVQPAHIDRENPVLLVSIGQRHYTRELIDASGGFVAHLLLPSQAEIGWNFACDSGRSRDKLAGLPVTTTGHSLVRLTTCRAWLECRVFARLVAGDRLYYWSDVVNAGEPAEGPLLTARTFFSQLSPAQRARLAELQQQDVQLERPHIAAWRGALPGWLQPLR